MEKQVPRCSVSVRKRRQKRVSEYFSSVKAGRIVVHGDLQVSDITIAKQTVHCLCLEFEKLLSFCEWRIPAWGLSELFQAHPSSFQFKASWDILSNALSGRPQPSPDPAVVILKYNNCRTGRRLRSSTQTIWLNISGSLKLITWRVSVVAVESGLQIYVGLLRCSCRLFQRLLWRLYRLHWQPQDLRQQKFVFFPIFQVIEKILLLNYLNNS